MGLVLSAARRSAARVVSAGAAGDIIGLSSQLFPRRFRRLGASPGAGPRRALSAVAGRVADERRPSREGRGRFSPRPSGPIPGPAGLPPCARSSRWCATRRTMPCAWPSRGPAWTPTPRSLRPRCPMHIRAASRSKRPWNMRGARWSWRPKMRSCGRGCRGSMSRGDLDAALEAAQKAETLSPALARTQTVLGFAYLTRIEIDKAKMAFERAIQGDPADPFPRLGMGLGRSATEIWTRAPARSRPPPRSTPTTPWSGVIWERPITNKSGTVSRRASTTERSSSIPRTRRPGSTTPSKSRPPIGRSRHSTTCSAPSS